MATPDRDINRPTSILAAIGVVVMAPMFFLVMNQWIAFEAIAETLTQAD